MLPPGLTPARFQHQARLKLLRGWCPIPKATVNAPSVTQRTFHATLAMPGGFDLVRLVYISDGVSSWALDKWGVAPSAQLGSGYAAVDSTGAAVTWTQGFCNNNGADSLFPSPSGTTPGMAVPAATGNDVYGQAVTDWVQVSSLDRSDGGTYPLLMCRSVITGGRLLQPSISAGGDLALWQDPTINRGHEAWYYYKAGDFVATPTGFTNPTTGNFMAPFAVQYYSRKLGATVLGIGDSITEGSNSASANAGWGFLACNGLTAAGRPVQWFNAGYRGATSAQYAARGRAMIDIVRPEVVVIPTWTPNDPLTQAGADGAWQMAVQLAYYARQTGAVPILWTSIPSNALTAQQDAIRGANNAKALAAGLPCADFNAVIGTGANPNQIAPAYNTDGVHPNDAGHAAMAAALRPILARILG